MEGSEGACAEATGALKWVSEARWEQLTFMCRFRGYRDPDVTFHAALSLEQGLGSTA